MFITVDSLQIFLIVHLYQVSGIHPVWINLSVHYIYMIIIYRYIIKQIHIQYFVQDDAKDMYFIVYVLIRLTFWWILLRVPPSPWWYVHAILKTCGMCNQTVVWAGLDLVFGMTEDMQMPLGVLFCLSFYVMALLFQISLSLGLGQWLLALGSFFHSFHLFIQQITRCIVCAMHCS